MVEAVCIASGPSLTQCDVDLVKQWREAQAGRIVIVANTTFRIAPWADFHFALDDRWWKVYGAEFSATFKGQGHCFHGSSGARIAKSLQRVDGFQTFGNTGTGCIKLAQVKGATRIVLLGYDCQRTKGKAHWHVDHPKGMGNAGSLHKWPIMFDKLARSLSGVEVVNASAETALKCFVRQPLANALGIA